MSGVGAERTLREAPAEPGTRCRPGAPKVGWPARSSPLPWKRGALGLPHPLYTLGPANHGLWFPPPALRAHWGPSQKLANADPAINPKTPKFPRNTSNPLRGGHPVCTQTKNPVTEASPLRAARESPQLARGAAEPATAPRALAALRGCQRKASPEPPSLQWDQSGKRDLPGERGRGTESQRSPLES